MTTSQVPTTSDGIVVLAHQALTGAIELAATLSLKQNLAADIAADLYDFVGAPGTDPATSGKQGTLNQARNAVTNAAVARRLAVQNGRSFTATAVDHLKVFFGRRWNPLWLSVGFTTGSLALPRDPLPLVLKLRAHFIANPAHELASSGLTAAAANALAAAIQAAVSAESAAINARNDARDDREESLERLRRRLVGVRAELDQLMEDDDHRWRRFGFSRPADRHIPAMATGLTLRAGGVAGEVIATWSPSSGAENYRVMRTVLTVDTTPMEVGVFTDPTAIISGLPSGKTVSVTVTARNEAGETQPTTEVFLVA